MRYIPSIYLKFGFYLQCKHISIYRKKTRAHVQNRPCGMMGAKIAFVFGFHVHDMEFVEFDRNVFLVDCLFKKT